MSLKKIGFAVVLVVVLVIGFLFWNTRPDRVVDAFLDAVEDKNQEAAMAFVSENAKPEKSENVEWFVEDWVSGDTIEAEVERDEAWRSRVMTKEENGVDVPVLNKYGAEKREIKPTPRYWAHLYQAYATVTFDDLEDPVIIKLKRETEEAWSPLAQLFKPWKIVAVRYQPIDEEDFYDIELSDDAFEIIDESEAVDGSTDTVVADDDTAEDDPADDAAEVDEADDDAAAESENETADNEGAAAEDVE